MSGCCSQDQDFGQTSRTFRQRLWLVVAINAVMFGVEMTAGRLGHSGALQADALDFMADAATYGLSLAVLGASLKVRAGAAMVKAVSLVLMGVWVMSSALWQISTPVMPKADVMGGIGTLALAANLLSVWLLVGFRNGDANIRSVWLCSRNDAIGNVAVIVAGLAVWGTATKWPDVIVAVAIAGLFLYSAIQIFRQAVSELRDPALPAGAD